MGGRGGWKMWVFVKIYRYLHLHKPRVLSPLHCLRKEVDLVPLVCEDGIFKDMIKWVRKLLLLKKKKKLITVNLNFDDLGNSWGSSSVHASTKNYT